MTTKLLLFGLGAVAIYALVSDKKKAGTPPMYPGTYPSQSNGSGSVQTGSIVDGIVRLGSEAISAYTTSKQNSNVGPDGYLTPNWINGGGSV